MSYEVWGEPDDGPELPDGWLDEDEAEELQRNVADLAILVARLARALRKAAPAHDLPAKAMEYLQHEGLCESPLRDTPNAQGQRAALGPSAAPQSSAATEGD